jgi:membrane-associated phospholipid phosphatase
MAALPASVLLASFESFERELTHQLNCRFVAPFWDWLLPRVMDKEIAVPVVLAVLLGAAFWNRRRALRAFLTALVAWGLCWCIATLAWAVLERPRPWRVHEPLLRTEAEIATCEATPGSLVVRGHASVRPGFPSRHALSAAVFAVSLWGISRWLGVVASVFALLVAWGRVYKGVHWPSDVVVGLVVGALVAWGTWRILPRILALGGHRHWVEDPPGEPG